MTTPICDFVHRYSEKQPLRLHMPGHKGKGALDLEQLDITEIAGADSLYEADGIIAQSEANASHLFGCRTFYSAEGSSQCIRAMMYLVCLNADKTKGRPVIMAARNVHKTFISAAALLDFDIEWIYPRENQSYLSCIISAKDIEDRLSQAEQMPVALYLTSPDYLGNIADIKGIAEVCHKYNVMLIVDNAHGAYLRFLPQSQHPIDLGADLCCDSAQKTLPVITGGAYLHLSDRCCEQMFSMVKNALVMFGSTSPSYIIMQSLDMANAYIADGYSEKLKVFIAMLDATKEKLVQHGFLLTGVEKLKITLCTKSYGYKGTELAQYLEDRNIICEFADPDYIVFMFTPEIEEGQMEYFTEAMCGVPRKPVIEENPPRFSMANKVMSVRTAVLSQSEEVKVEDAEGKVLAATSVSCPPAVPIVVCGEKIDTYAIEQFRYYGIKNCRIVK